MKRFNKLICLMIPVMFSSLTGCNINAREDISVITYTHADGMTWYKEEFVIDFVNNRYTEYFLDMSTNEKSVLFETTFTGEQEEALIIDINKVGIQNIKESYSPRDLVFDGGSWTLDIEFDDGTNRFSSGYAAAPDRIFSRCAPYFQNVLGTSFFCCQSDSSFDRNHISISAHYETKFDDRILYTNIAQEEVGYDFKGVEKECSNLYQVNKNHLNNHLVSNEEYELHLDFNKNSNISSVVLKSFDYNEELTNEKTVLTSTEPNIKTELEFNKIYLYEVQYNDKGYAQFTFNTVTDFNKHPYGKFTSNCEDLSIILNSDETCTIESYEYGYFDDTVEHAVKRTSTFDGTIKYRMYDNTEKMVLSMQFETELVFDFEYDYLSFDYGNSSGSIGTFIEYAENIYPLFRYNLMPIE